jgi:hypothetical protein
MNINDFTDGPLKSVSDLIDLHESLPSDAYGGARWVFRGQPRDFGTLVPSFQRQFSRQSVGTAKIIERRLIDAFRVHYADLKDRSADMPLPARISSGFDLRCLSVMQHYEIPTRLLDWTSDFWTALYFASVSDQESTAELWCYDRRLFEPQRYSEMALATLVDSTSNPPVEPEFLDRRSDELIVELDPQITPRMKQQAAHHTVSSSVFSDHAPLIFALDEKFVPPNKVGSALRRVLIEASCKSKMLQFLAEHKNITASTVFPDVVGLGRFLRWQFESLRTMLL